MPVIEYDAAARSGLAVPALAYDYFKSMISLSVATLGGILTLSEAVFGTRIAPLQMGLAALLVAVAGMLALQGQTDVTQLCLRIKPPLNSSRLALRLVPSFYGLGVGYILGLPDDVVHRTSEVWLNRSKRRGGGQDTAVTKAA